MSNETWMNQYDAETKHKLSIRVVPEEIPRPKVKRPRRVERKMAATFFSTSGHMSVVALENQKHSEGTVVHKVPAGSL